MTRYSIILILCFRIVRGQQCNNMCFVDIESSLRSLQELSEKSPSASIIQSNFGNINVLMKRTEDTLSNIRILEETKNKSLSSYHTIPNSSKKIDLLNKIINQIDAINKELHELQYKKEKYNEALVKWDEANRLYKTLRGDVQQITRTGNDINRALEVVSKQKDVTEKQSLDIKNDLDEFVISDDIFRDYLCKSTLQTMLQDILNIVRGIAHRKVLFAEIINLKLKEVKNNITEHEQSVEEIRKVLNEKLPETDLRVVDETKLILEDLKGLITDLKNKTKQIKLVKTFEDILSNAKKDMRELINEYENILNHTFSAENINNVKEEIEKAKETLCLLKERSTTKAELDDIRRLAAILQDRKICFINETVSVEDKT